ncbi:MAG: response regulator [Gemmatimonadales bacterium]
MTPASRAPAAGLSPAYRASVIAGIYVVAGSLWILFSDEAVAAMARDPATLTRLQNWKGWAFVVVTGALVYTLVTAALRSERHLQEELRRADAHLRHSQKLQAIGELTSGVAHDFKNVLSVITANGELVRGTLAPGSEPATAMQDLLLASDHAVKLVRTLLGIARQRDLAPVPTDLAVLLERYAPMLQRLLSSRYDLIVQREGEASVVVVDPDAIEQVILNLVTNARDAAPEGGPIVLRLRGPVTELEADSPGAAPLLRFGAEEAEGAGPFVVLEVADHGCGITDAVRERLFEPFHTTKPVGLGTGLGLSMVLGLMRQQGGFVTLRTTPGRGSVFGLIFPAAIGAVPSVQDAVDEGPGPDEGGSETILLVEDQPELRRTASRLLRRVGYGVLEAADGAEALATYRRDRETIDLVLTDLVMPGMDGMELIAALREAGATMPMILTSGRSFTPAEGTSVVHGPDRLLPKPWTIAELMCGVREALDSREA